MKYKYILLLMTLVLTAVDVSAQKALERQTKPDTALVVKNYIDSLALLRPYATVLH